MKREMAPYYWSNLPESKAIPSLIAEAPRQTDGMVAQSRAKVVPPEVFGTAPVPASSDLDEVERAVQTCRACPLWRNATCAVFGEGPRDSRVMVVGEQPGDQEDRAGKPFVGLAGKLLDRASPKPAWSAERST